MKEGDIFPNMLQQVFLVQTATSLQYVEASSTQHPAASSSTPFWRFCSTVSLMRPLPMNRFMVALLLLYHSISIVHAFSNKVRLLLMVVVVVVVVPVLVVVVCVQVLPWALNLSLRIFGSVQTLKLVLSKHLHIENIPECR